MHLHPRERTVLLTSVPLFHSEVLRGWQISERKFGHSGCLLVDGIEINKGGLLNLAWSTRRVPRAASRLVCSYDTVCFDVQ